MESILPPLKRESDLRAAKAAAAAHPVTKRAEPRTSSWSPSAVACEAQATDESLNVKASSVTFCSQLVQRADPESDLHLVGNQREMKRAETSDEAGSYA